MPPTVADFASYLEARFKEAEANDLDAIEINAGALHAAAGGGTGNDARLPSCCAAMRRLAVSTDLAIHRPPKGDGSSLTIRYDIPRTDRDISLDSTWADVETPEVQRKAHQRLDATSNTHAGREFEQQAADAPRSAGISLTPSYQVSVGVGALRKGHRFDFGSNDPPILVECKSHRWTSGGNAPSAKLTVWNEAMYLFATAPIGYRKILFVLRDYSTTRRQTLAEHYVSRYLHLIPNDVEIWEYDPSSESTTVIDTRGARTRALNGSTSA